MLVLRLLLLISFMYMAAFSIYFLIQNDRVNIYGRAVTVGLAFLLLGFSIMSLTGIFRIKYDPGSRKITFYHLFRSRTIFVSDIDGYYQSTVNTKWKNYPGYFVEMKNGSVFELNEYNVKSLKGFHSFIVESGIPYKGTKYSAASY